MNNKNISNKKLKNNLYQIKYQANIPSFGPQVPWAWTIVVQPHSIKTDTDIETMLVTLIKNWSLILRILYCFL